MRRLALVLGIIGAALGVSALALMLIGVSELSSPEVGVLIRVAAILIAVALVLPVMRRPSLTTMLLVGAGLIIVLVRPALIWVGLLLWGGWFFFGRHSRTDRSDS